LLSAEQFRWDLPRACVRSSKGIYKSLSIAEVGGSWVDASFGFGADQSLRNAMGKGLNDMDQYQKEHIFAGAIIAVGMICGSIALMKLGIISVVLSSSSALPFLILLIGTTVISGGLITLGSAMWSRARSHSIREEQTSALDKNRHEPASA
jgi:hypothetical protein